MPQGYIKEATYQFKYLYHPSSNSFVLQSILQVSFIESGGHWRFLRGVLVVFDKMDVSRIHQGSYMSLFRSLPSWEVLHLLCVSRASSWSHRGRLWFLTGVLVVFTMVDAPRIYQSIFRSLPSKKMVQLLGSPEHPPSVILGV